MDDVVDASEGQRRSVMILLGTFAGTVASTMIGIYGVIAYSMAQRTKEVGIRRALGAQQADILRLVLRPALGLAIAGAVAGVAGAFALTRVMKHLLSKSARPIL